MGFFKRKTAHEVEPSEKATPQDTPANTTPANGSIASSPVQTEHHDGADIDKIAHEAKVSPLAYMLGGVASIGGFMFGYESGQISGFMEMSDFLQRFGQQNSSGTYYFSAARSGTIVGLLCIGTLIGCLFSAPLADNIGRRYTISASAFFYIIGVIIEITSDTVWVQFAMGRLVAGIGIGALSVSVPMYQSESIPRAIRGAVVSSYQLLITLGIWTAYMINYGTEDQYNNSAQWRIPNGLSALWAILLGSSILLLPESPRFAYRVGRIEEARNNMARLNGVAPDSPLINAEIAEIEEKLAAEKAGGDHPWYEIFTGPRMLYRTLLGMSLQAGQQLTGANFFFYYGTTIFAATGLSNSYVTSIILGTVNVVATIAGLYIVKTCGRRKSLLAGSAWMAMCLFIYAFVGRFQDPTTNKSAGNVMIVFTCLFIVAFATTWGPLPWAIVGELYPARYRATCMALATASNWLMNFLISFFSTFITNKIHWLYGLVFAVACIIMFFIVYFFLIESKNRSLEEIDTMYILHVNPITSAKWDPRDVGGLVNTDDMHLSTGGRAKVDQAGNEGLFAHQETANGTSNV